MEWIAALAETGWLLLGWLAIAFVVLVVLVSLGGCRHPQSKPGTKTCTYWKVDGGNEVECR